LKDLENAIGFAEEIGRILKFTIKVLAEKLESNLNNFSAMSIYWSSLEIKFHQLLLHLPNDKDKALFGWFDFVNKTAVKAFYKTADSLTLDVEEKAIVNAERVFYSEKKVLLDGTKDGKRTGNPIYKKYLPVKEKEVTL
jgi:hypothetical protein